MKRLHIQNSSIILGKKEEAYHNYKKINKNGKYYIAALLIVNSLYSTTPYCKFEAWVECHACKGWVDQLY